MRILGIDPGLRRTGFGVIECHQAGRLHYIGSGCISVPADQPLYLRLKLIGEHIEEVVTHYRPDVACMEKVFVNSNPQSTLLLGHARGAALLSLARLELAISEYTALQIKKAVVGHGHAQKVQVQAMVQYLLKLSSQPSVDPADALACAICHANHSPLVQRLSKHLSNPQTTDYRTLATDSADPSAHASELISVSPTQPSSSSLDTPSMGRSRLKDGRIIP